MAFAKIVQRNICHDCRSEIRIEESGQISNGLELVYDINGEKRRIFKCKDCFDKDKSLKNYQGCEVYSRVCGYLRPVQQWNFGKQQEFEERKEYEF